MAPYTYSKLNFESQEIRLLTLHPGIFEDPIDISIYHKPFPTKEYSPPNIFINKDIEKSLPAGWFAFVTLDDRILYTFDDRKVPYSSWAHPDPHYSFNQIENDNHIDKRNDFEPIFEAFSYTWGSSDDPETAYVHESAHVISSLKIGQNLCCALKHLRYPDKPRILWIDSICINQGDLEECESQVLRMRDIYKLADRVLIWLGPAFKS
jgi:hypothetical protein